MGPPHIRQEKNMSPSKWNKRGRLGGESVGSTTIPRNEVEGKRFTREEERKIAQPAHGWEQGARRRDNSSCRSN